MDVYGLKPKTEKGEYFRNNVWWWHPLWDFCEYLAPEIASKVKLAHENSGDGLNASDSRKLGFHLKDSLANNKAESYIQLYYKSLESLPKEVCSCCFQNLFDYFEYQNTAFWANNNLAYIVAGATLEDSYDKTGEIPFPKSKESKKGQPKQDCTSCNGSGLKESFNKNYHINLENIESFAEFLLDCGGFRIC